MPDEPNPGRIAYEAYGASADWTTFDGQPMLAWAELPDRVATAWAHAAYAAAAGPPGGLRITGSGWAGTTTIELDGKPIVDGLARMNLIIDARTGPQLHLTFGHLPGVNAHIDGQRHVTVDVPETMRELLLAAGWTPPEGEPAANEGLTAP